MTSHEFLQSHPWITYRQLNYWGVNYLGITPGSGYRVRFTPADVRALHALALLHAEELLPNRYGSDTAWRVAAAVFDNPEAIIVVLAAGAVTAYTDETEAAHVAMTTPCATVVCLGEGAA